MQESVSGTVPSTVFDHSLVVRDAFLYGAVVIWIEWNTEFFYSTDEQLTQRMVFVNVRNMLRPANAMIVGFPGRAIL